MFEEGNLLYFDPFIFKNGASPEAQILCCTETYGG